MDTPDRKAALRYLFQRIIEPMGYKFTPDVELAEFLLDHEVSLEREHGSPFCPCQLRTGKRPQDMLIVCPCIPFHRKHFDAMKRCWCGLFVHVDVANPDSLSQFAPDDE